MFLSPIRVWWEPAAARRERERTALVTDKTPPMFICHTQVEHDEISRKMLVRFFYGVCLLSRARPSSRPPSLPPLAHAAHLDVSRDGLEGADGLAQG